MSNGPADLPSCVPPSAHNATVSGTGILTSCPSPTPFGLGLGPTNPTRINLAVGTLRLTVGAISHHALRYSCRHSHFRSLQRCLTAPPSLLTERSPTPAV